MHRELIECKVIGKLYDVEAKLFRWEEEEEEGEESSEDDEESWEWERIDTCQNVSYGLSETTEIDYLHLRNTTMIQYY